MSIYLDSAIATKVEAVRSLGWVHGVTTNPLLLAGAGVDVQATLKGLARLNAGELFYQLVSPTLEGMFAEMRSAAVIVGSALVLKVPPTQAGFQFVSQCREFPCCVTAVYHLALPHQVLVSLIHHPLTEQTLSEFQSNGTPRLHRFRKKPKKDKHHE